MLPHHMPGDHYNVAKCLAVCLNLTYAYAGLTRGSQCRCGHSYGPSADSRYTLVSAGEEVIASHGEVTQCRLGCAGARDVYNVLYKGWSCGGYDQSAVYTYKVTLSCTAGGEYSGSEGNLTCKVPPLFTTLSEYENAVGAEPALEDICEPPSDSLAEKIVSATRHNSAHRVPARDV